MTNNKNSLVVKQTLKNLPSISLKIKEKKMKVSTEFKEIRPRETQALLDETFLRIKEGKIL